MRPCQWVPFEAGLLTGLPGAIRCHARPDTPNQKGAPMVTTLYVKYGSRVTSGTAEILYDRIMADDQLNHFFVHVDIDKLREHMADLLSVLCGGPDIYAGRDLKTAHEGFHITKADFDRVAAHLAASLAAVGLEEDEISWLMTEVAKSAPEVISA